MIGKKELDRFTAADANLLEDEYTEADESSALLAKPYSSDAVLSGGSFKRLNRAVAQMIDDYSLVSFLKLDVKDEDSVGAVLSYIDDAIQFHDAQEPKEPNDAQEVDYE